MSVSKDFIAGVFAMAAEKLAVGNFQKRKPGIFTLGLNTEIIGWIGLNTAHYEDGVAINPVVGVRHQKLETLIAELLDSKPSKYIPPSFSRPVSYLMPQKKYVEWSFKEGDDCEPLAGEMVAAIEKFGRPFMEQNSTLETLYKTLLNSKRGTPPDQLDYRIAVASVLLGKRAEAEAFIDAKLREIGNRTDEAAAWFRKFATKIRER
jgi:hypothetical protein